MSRHLVDSRTPVFGDLRVGPLAYESRVEPPNPTRKSRHKPSDSRKLEGTDDCYRLRQGDYRLVYTILEDRVVVLVLRAGHRGDV